MIRIPFFLLVGFFLSSCHHRATSPNDATRALKRPPQPSVTVATYNVENLFDTEHDQGKDDYAFLPLAQKQTDQHRAFCAKIMVRSWRRECEEKDWTERKLTDKLARLTGVLKTMANGGPDVVVLQEVENKAVLERWNNEFLNGRYTVILLEGPDKRGIDVAVMSRLPLAQQPRLITTPYQFDDPKAKEDSRALLRVGLTLPDKTTLVVYAAHLPNPMHPAALRSQALDHLVSITTEERAQHTVVVAGDFNITSNEESQLGHTKKLAREWWISGPALRHRHRGTYYYKPKDNWSFLDWIMVAKAPEPEQSLKTKKRWQPVAADVVKTAPGQSTTRPGRGSELFPARYDRPRVKIGISDHYPIVVTLSPIRP